MARRVSLFMNCTLVLLAILGILFILSGHSQTFLNKEGFVNIGDISPGAYPGAVSYTHLTLPTTPYV